MIYKNRNLRRIWHKLYSFYITYYNKNADIYKVGNERNYCDISARRLIWISAK